MENEKLRELFTLRAARRGHMSARGSEHPNSGLVPSERIFFSEFSLPNFPFRILPEAQKITFAMTQKSL